MYLVTWHKDWSDKGKVLHSPDNEGPKVEGKIVKQINMADNFTFSTYDQLTAEQIGPINEPIRVYNTMTGEFDFEGRVFQITQGTDQEGAPYYEFTCEGLLGYLNDVGIGYGKTKKTLRDHFLYFLEVYNNILSDDQHKDILPGNLTYSQLDREVYFEYFSEDSAFEIIVNRLVGTYGGELNIRRVGETLYLDWVDTIGHISDTPIHTGHNLLQVEKTSDYSEYKTTYVPLGAKLSADSAGRLTIKSVNNDSEYLYDEGAPEFGTIMKWLVYDDIDDPAELKAQAEIDISNQQFSHDQYTVSAIDLALIGMDIESFKLGNGYLLTDDILRISNEILRVVRIEIDLNEPQMSKITIGDKYTDLSEYQNNQARLGDYRYRKLNEKADTNAAEIVKTQADLQTTNDNLANFIDIYNQFVTDYGTFVDNYNSAVSSINDRLSALESGGGGGLGKYFPVDYSLPGINFWTRETQPEMAYGTRSTGFHSGWDIGSGGYSGYAIYATTSGTVRWSGWKDGGIGNCIYIEHSTDSYWSNYMHLASMSVSEGDTVTAGQQIGIMGNSGGDYAIHLHFELSPDGVFHSGGNTVDPQNYLGITGDNTTSLPNPAG